MFNQFFIYYPNNIMLPTFPTLSTLQTYPCSLYSYNQIYEPVSPFSDIQNNNASEQISEIKEEQPTSRNQSQSLKQPISKFKYAKKNVQSNVVNQCFSYITTRHKSINILSKVLKTKEKIDTFYQIMKKGKRQQTKYMGRNVLQNLLQLDDDHPVYILRKKLQCKVSLKISEIRLALRILINYFLKNLIVPTILTSAKLDRSTIKEHIARAREIHTFLNQNPSPFS